MLQVTPEIDREILLKDESDDALYCRACGHLVTRHRWGLSRGGTEHRLTNPLGFVFTVICFSEAPGAETFGVSTHEHTWFEGYEWCFVLCRICQEHLGWHYSRGDSAEGFFGLIKDRLSAGKRST